MCEINFDEPKHRDTINTKLLLDIPSFPIKRGQPFYNHGFLRAIETLLTCYPVRKIAVTEL